MFDLNLVTRLQYTPSGKLDVARFLGGSAILVLASCVSGFVSGLLYSGMLIVPVLSHLLVLVPIAIAIPLAWLVAKFVRFSHCRNPLAATFVGVACGVITFLSACQIVGAAATLHEGQQTSFLVAATRTDQIQRAIVGRVFHSRSQNGEVESRLSLSQSIFLMIEIGILVWIPATSGRSFARRAYGEAIDCWLDGSIIRAIPGSGEKIISVLVAGEYLVQTLTSLPLCSTDPRPTNSKLSRLRLAKQTTGDVAASWMVLEVSPFPAANGAYEAYLTATEVDSHGKMRSLFQQLRLRSHEIAAARKLFMESTTDRKAHDVRIENEQVDVVTTGRQVGEASNKSVLHGV